MHAFDLPDYSKSSEAQNEKLPLEREKQRVKGEGGREDSAGAPVSMPVSPLSQILPLFSSCFQEICLGSDA